MVESRELFTDRFYDQFGAWRAGETDEPPWLVERLRYNGVIRSLDEYAGTNGTEAFTGSPPALFPLRIYAGTLDSDVPPTEAFFAQRLWGDRIELVVLEGASHEQVATRGLLDVRKWFDELSSGVE
jgi:hypothetical protein